jgi:hypothetical protein
MSISCKHGHRRQCELCDAEQEIATLTARVAELEAACGQWKEQFDRKDWELQQARQQLQPARELSQEIARAMPPHYAYGDNEAACWMASRLHVLWSLLRERQPNADGGSQS